VSFVRFRAASLGFVFLGFVPLCALKLCTLIWGIVDVKISESVGFCKIALVLNYFGQAAYLLQHEGETLQELVEKWKSILFIMPDWFQPIGIVIATLAAVIATSIN
jgi:KUP system potassium uptake protein